MLAILAPLGGSALFLKFTPTFILAGALLHQLGYFFDVMDGEIARLRKKDTIQGAFIDAVYLEFKNYALPAVRKVEMGFRKRGILPMDTLHTKLSKHSFIKNILTLLGLFDFYLRYACKVYPLLVRGGIVLSDRYIYDIFMGRFKIARNNLLKRTVFWFTPKPDICFVVKRDPTAIKACREDQDIAAISVLQDN